MPPSIPPIMALLEPSAGGFAWVLVIALTVLVLDTFFQTDLLSHAALLGVGAYFSLLFDVALKWQILIGLASWLVAIALFYLVWRRLIHPLIARVFKEGHPEANHQAAGARAEYRLIDGKPFAQWNGDLWPVDIDDFKRFEDHQSVRIAALKDGRITLKAD